MNSYLLAAAISGIVLGATGVANAETRTNTSAFGDDSVQLDETEKHGCKGQNQCKGQGGCRTDGQKADKSGKSSCSGPSGCGSK